MFIYIIFLYRIFISLLNITNRVSIANLKSK